MGSTTYIKIISAILILMLVIVYPSKTLSESFQVDSPDLDALVLPSQFPTPPVSSNSAVLQETPTPTVYYSNSDELHLEKKNVVMASNSESVNIPESSTSAQFSEDQSISTSSGKITVDIKINSNNITDIDRSTNIKNNTGGNQSNTNISLAGPIEIKTGIATSSAEISTVINTNIVGQGIQPVIVNVFSRNQPVLDYLDLTPCTSIKPITSPYIGFNTADKLGNNIRVIKKSEYSSSIGVNNKNKANVANNINLRALTGRNEAIDNIGGETSIDTGDAYANLDMFNMANTNLVGNCGFFFIANIFSPYNNNITLPYELPIIFPKQEGDKKGAPEFKSKKNVVNKNKSRLETYTKTSIDTGDNEILNSINFFNPASIDSGTADSKINTIDTTNTNVVGNNYLYLKINNYGNWEGKIKGWMGDVFEKDKSIVLIDTLSINSPKFKEKKQPALVGIKNNIVSIDEIINDNILDVENDNDAKIQNNINLTAETGINKAGRFNSKIKTGLAAIKGNIVNLANTNIVGNNWFYGIINILSDFTGNIIFPRPDLTIKLTASRSVFEKGSIITFSIKYSNEGLLTAKNTVVINNTPKDTALVSVSNGGVFKNSHVSWNLGSIQPGEKGTLQFNQVVIGNNMNAIKNTSVISTTTPEAIKENNSSSLSLTRLKVPKKETKNKINNIKKTSTIGKTTDAPADLTNESSANSSQEPEPIKNDPSDNNPKNYKLQNAHTYFAEAEGSTSINGSPLILGKAAVKNKKNTNNRNTSGSKLCFSLPGALSIGFIIYLFGLLSGIIISRRLPFGGLK